MPDHNDGAVEAYIAASATLLGITIAPEWLPHVKSAFAGTSRATEFVEAFPLPDEIEPAPVFEA